MFQAPLIDMEPAAQPIAVGDFDLVDHPERPAVAAFFQSWGDRTLLINGLSTRSVNHETCQTIALTGSPSDVDADWPSVLGAASADAFFLPHLVLSGPVYPGNHSVFVSRAEGRLEQAIRGTIVETCDQPQPMPTPGASAYVDAQLTRRATRLASRWPDVSMPATYVEALTRAQALVAAGDAVSLPPTSTILERGLLAVSALSAGLARCITVAHDGLWDTHFDNNEQTPLFQELFTALDAVMSALMTTAGPGGAPLADDTLVVVMSEMGRTPALNGTSGRDHWPFTSALVAGPGITGGRTIGGFTELFGGIGVDPATGELDHGRVGVDAATFGSTLLTLGGVDPGPVLGSVEPIRGVLTDSA